VIRRRKAFFGEKAPFPVAGNRSPENFTAFPLRETVFRAIFPLSRGGKPFFNFKKPFSAAGRGNGDRMASLGEKECFSLWLWVNIFSD